MILSIFGVLGLIVTPLLLPANIYAQPQRDPNAQDTVEVCAAGSGGACENFVDKYINPVVTLLTVVIGVGAAISIVVAGIQYASAGSDPGKVQKAKERIGQTLLGLLAYILIFAFINYIVPGGIF